MDWQAIESAPRDGTPVQLKCETHPEYGEHLMYWDARRRRWAGYAFAVMRRVDTWWDEEAAQPTHWAETKAAHRG